MLIRKVGGKVCGAKLTAAEKKAMDIEIQKETAEYVRKTAFEIDAIVLWIWTCYKRSNRSIRP
jgi:hypothetical protein